MPLLRLIGPFVEIEFWKSHYLGGGFDRFYWALVRTTFNQRPQYIRVSVFCHCCQVRQPYELEVGII